MAMARTNLTLPVELIREVDEFAGELFQGEELNEAGQRFTDACSALQGIADDNQIDVDLDCQPD